MFLRRSSVPGQDLTSRATREAAGLLCFDISGPNACASLALLVFSTCVTVVQEPVRRK